MDDEIASNWELVAAPLGDAWSGRARYAAAMFFHQRGEMNAEVLEIYRICSRLDAEDPLAVIKKAGVGADWLARLAAHSGER